MHALARGTLCSEVWQIRGRIDEPVRLRGAAATGRYVLVVSDEAKQPTRVRVLIRQLCDGRPIGGLTRFRLTRR
jgi:hypothetical protein